MLRRLVTRRRRRRHQGGEDGDANSERGDRDPSQPTIIQGPEEIQAEDPADYRRGGYHPVHIGDYLDEDFSNYLVAGKLGWGHFSTVWLCYDFDHHDFVAVKVVKSAKHYSDAALDEIKLCVDLRSCIGCVQLYDHFELRGPNGRHICLVFECVGENLLSLIRKFQDRDLPIPTELIKQIARDVLVALVEMRKKGIIHTDLKPENVLFTHLPGRVTRIVDGFQVPKRRRPGRRRGFGGLGGARRRKRMDRPVFEPLRIPLDAQLGRPAFGRRRRAAASASSANVGSQAGAGGGSGSSGSGGGGGPAKQPSTLRRGLFGRRRQGGRGQGGRKKGRRNPTGAATGSGAPADRDRDRDRDADAGGADEPSQIVQYPESGEDGAGKLLIVKESLVCKLADFGNACWTHKHFTDDIQTRQYRAPEVILGRGYDTSSDIWSVACIIFELLTFDYMFNPKKGRRYSKNDDHLAQMIELLGPLNRRIATSGKYHSKYFGRNGELLKIGKLKFWDLRSVIIEKYEMEEEEGNLLADFLFRMLNFDPKKRETAEELLKHPWIAGDTSGVRDHDYFYRMYQEYY